MAVAAVSLSRASVSRASVYARWGVAVDRGMQVRVADPGLLRSRLASLGSFGLLGAAAMNAPPATVRDFSDFLDVDVHHLSWSFRDDDLRFSGGVAVRVDDLRRFSPRFRRIFRHGPASNDDAVGAQART